MLLLIDSDNNSKTGWYGYDYLVNQNVKNEQQTTLMRYENEKWVEISHLNYRKENNQLEIEIPRRLLNLSQDQFIIDFKWSDNPEELVDPISFCLNGDTAPNRRFNYRLIWEK